MNKNYEEKNDAILANESAKCRKCFVVCFIQTISQQIAISHFYSEINT